MIQKIKFLQEESLHVRVFKTMQVFVNFWELSVRRTLVSKEDISEERSIKMKKRYIIAGIILALLVAAVIWAFPLLRAAGILHGMGKGEGFEGQITVTLKEEALSQEEEQFVHTLSKLFSVEETSLLSLRGEGRMAENSGYAEIYCEGVSEPVTDVYFSQEETWINVEMLYERLQETFARKYPILGNILPNWECGAYISLEQIEEIFQVDVNGMWKTELPKEDAGQSAWKTFLLLAGMNREKAANGRQQFKTEWNGYQIQLEVGKEDKTPVLAVWGTDMQENRKLTAFEGEFSAGKAEAVVFPEDVMQQEEISRMKTLWSVIQKLQQSTEGL